MAASPRPSLHHSTDAPDLIGAVLDCIRYCFVLVDPQGRYRYVNATHRSILQRLGVQADTLIGARAFSWANEEAQDDAGDSAIAALQRTLEQRQPAQREIWIGTLGRWYRQSFFPMPDGGAAMIAHDITEQKRGKLNADFLADLQLALYSAARASDIVDTVRSRLAAYLDLDRLVFAEIDSRHARATTVFDIGRDGQPRGNASYRLEDFLDAHSLDELGRGWPVVINDVDTDERTLPRLDAYRQQDARAMLVAPYCNEQGLRFTLSALMGEPRSWREDEIGLFRDIATRTYLSVERARAASALRMSERRYRAMIAASAQASFRFSPDFSCLIQVSGRSFPVRGRIPDPHWQAHYLMAEDRPGVRAHLARAMREKSPFQCELRLRGSADPPMLVTVHVVPVLDDSGDVCEWFGTADDITAKRRIEDALAVSNERLKLAIEGSGDGVIDYHARSNEHILSPRAWQILGFPDVPPEPPFRDWESIVHPDEQAAFTAHLDEVLHHGVPALSMEHRVRCADGSWKWVLLRVHVVERDGDGQALRLTGLLSDVSEKRRSEEIIWGHANFDALTGLPNRRLFRDRLDHELRKAQRSHLPVALLFIDLDRFKEVNDLLGHAAGDQLLVEAAQRISGCVRASDTVARLGGDEFTAVLPDLDDVQHAQNVAKKIIDALATPFHLDAETVFVSASIGITLYPGDADNADDLVRNADQAMYAAKNGGRNQFSYFTPRMQSEAQNRLRLINDLRTAVASGQLEIHYQPLVDLATGRIQKAEALLRWRHPRQGLIDPVRFIPFAEESGLISQIGDWVFHEAAERARAWQDDIGRPFQVSVNTSPVQFSSHLTGTDLDPTLAELKRAGNTISVEITEGLLLNASPGVIAKLEKYRDAGIEVAIDDFGTGYSSIAYLKKFDIDYLKIDQSFIRDLESNSGDRTIVRSTIVMAHELGLRVIAEGIETPAQRQLLQDAGCDMGQGFLFSRPLPPAEFGRLLAADAFAAPTV